MKERGRCVVVLATRSGVALTSAFENAKYENGKWKTEMRRVPSEPALGRHAEDSKGARDSATGDDDGWQLEVVLQS